MHKIRKTTQLVWETVVTLQAKTTEPANFTSNITLHRSAASKGHPHNRPKEVTKSHIGTLSITTMSTICIEIGIHTVKAVEDHTQKFRPRSVTRLI